MLIKCYLSHSQPIVRVSIYLRPYHITLPWQHTPIKTEEHGLCFFYHYFSFSLSLSLWLEPKERIRSRLCEKPSLFSANVQLYSLMVTQMNWERTKCRNNVRYPASRNGWNQSWGKNLIWLWSEVSHSWESRCLYLHISADPTSLGQLLFEIDNFRI